MTTLIDLQMRVDTSQIDGATAKLKTLSDATTKAASASTTLGTSTQKAGSALASMGNDAKGAASGIDAVTRSHVGFNRELIVLGHELSQGNFKRFGGSLMVLTEQAGGVSNAFKILGSLITPMNVAIAGGVLAVVALTEAFVQASREQKEFAAAIGLTNNYAGLAMNSFHELATAVAQEANVSLGKSTDILMALAKGGTTAGMNMRDLATVVADFSKLSGEKFEKVAADFGKINTKPAEFAREMDAMMHIFTPAQLEMVEKLELTGHTTDATKLALQVFVDYMNGPGATALKAQSSWVDSLSQSFSNLWHNIKVSSGAMPASISELNTQIKNLQEQQGTMTDEGPIDNTAKINDLIAKRKALYEADAQAKMHADQVAKEALIKNADEYLDHFKKNTTRMEEELEHLHTAAKTAQGDPASAAKYTPEYVAQAEAELRRRYSPVKVANNTQDYKSQLAEVQGYLNDIEAAYKLNETKVKTLLVQGSLDQSQAGQQLEALRQKELKDEEVYLQKKIALAEALAKKTGNKQGLADAENFRNQLKKLQQEELQNTADANLKRAEQSKAFQKILTDETLAVQKAMTARQLAADRASSKATMSSGEAQQAAAQEAIIDKYADATARYNEQLKQKLITQEQYDDLIVKLTNDEALEHAQQDHVYAQQKAQQQSFSTGWNQAFNQYLEDAKNTAKDGQQLFGDMANGMSGALSNFVTTGKLNFNDFTKTILADFAKIAAEKLVAGIAGSLFGGDGYTAGGSAASNSADSIDAGGGWSPAMANGGAFNGGVQFFAKGDVFDSPTAFGMAGGKTGVMGEAGPEAIMPLSRGSDGKLGVKASTQPPNVQISAPINITMTGGDTGSASDRAALAKQVQTITESTFNRELTKAMRPGGVLNRVR